MGCQLSLGGHKELGEPYESEGTYGGGSNDLQAQCVPWCHHVPMSLIPSRAFPYLPSFSGVLLHSGPSSTNGSSATTPGGGYSPSATPQQLSPQICLGAMGKDQSSEGAGREEQEGCPKMGIVGVSGWIQDWVGDRSEDWGYAQVEYWMCLRFLPQWMQCGVH